MNFSEKYNCYWFTPKRTGTRSVKELLLVLEFQIADHTFYFNKKNQDSILISNVRNPYSRLVSLFHLYLHHISNFNMKFDEWIYKTLKNPLFCDSYQFYYHKDILKLDRPFNKFVRLENFEDDIKTIDFIDFTNPVVSEQFEFNIKNNRYKTEFENQMNEKRKNWKEFYNEELANFVHDNFIEQFELFEYHKNSWKNGTS